LRAARSARPPPRETLPHVDFLDHQIASLTETIGEQIAPFEPAVELLCTIPGVQRRSAERIIAEIGVDMSVFPTAKELASWAGQCPGNDQSAGRRRSGRTRKGSKWLDWALEEAALAATRSKDTYLAAQYARLRPRHGHKKALGAVKHSIIVAAWHMLSTGEVYRDLGGDYFQRRDPEKTHQAPRHPARTPRTHRHAREGGRLTRGYFPVRSPRCNGSRASSRRRSARSGTSCGF